MPRMRRQYKIQEVIKRRQVMLVQVVKEERGTKGAALTTYLSLAGRYSVLMPNTARGGGSAARSPIRATAAGSRRSRRSSRCRKAWASSCAPQAPAAPRPRSNAISNTCCGSGTVRDLTLKSTAPTLVYEEGSLVKRSIRDLYNKDIDEIVVAGDEAYKDAKEFMRMLMPSMRRM